MPRNEPPVYINKCGPLYYPTKLLRVSHILTTTMKLVHSIKLEFLDHRAQKPDTCMFLTLLLWTSSSQIIIELQDKHQ